MLQVTGRVLLMMFAIAALLFVLPACPSSSSTSTETTGTKTASPRYLMLVDAKNGAIDRDFPDADAPVFAVTSDGNGGWYIGGRFDYVGRVARNGIAHIRSDGSLDRGFVPALPGGAIVEQVFFSNGTVYVGGSGAYGPRVDALDARSGKHLWWVLTRKGNISGLAGQNGLLFVSGSFWHIGGAIRTGFAALDASNGKPTSWKLHLSRYGVISPSFGPLAIADGAVYLVGDFGRINRVKRENGLAAVSARTGNLKAWSPRRYRWGGGAIAISGDQVLLGPNFAAFDTRTARRYTWPKRLIGTVSSFAVSGDTVYIGGDADNGFKEADGTPAKNLVSVVLPEGRFTNWRPNLGRCTEVAAMAASGGKVLAAGFFSQIACSS
ncbi:MAG TPA: PQQ-binding-like beta-propeller repeat protein [Gaiellaceae bacterium]